MSKEMVRKVMLWLGVLALIGLGLEMFSEDPLEQYLEDARERGVHIRGE